MADPLPFLYTLLSLATLSLLTLYYHTQSLQLQEALRWNRQNLIPWSLLAVAYIGQEVLAIGQTLHIPAFTLQSSWFNDWGASFISAWLRSSQLGHHALVLPHLPEANILYSLLQAWICAFSQLLLGRYFLQSYGMSWSHLSMTHLLRLSLWPFGLLCALWWCIQALPATPSANLLKYLILPEFYVLLFPLHLLLLTGQNFWKASLSSLQIWHERCWPFIGTFAAALTLYTLLHLTQHYADQLLAGWNEPTSTIVFACLSALLHVWFYITMSVLTLQSTTFLRAAHEASETI